MNTKLIVTDKKHVIRHMNELYQHDISVYDENFRDLNDAGLFEYLYLDHYWTEKGRYPYLFTIDDKYVGFALIRKRSATEYAAGAHEIAEFFILRKYRKQGMGSHFAKALLEKHKGSWFFGTQMKNFGAQAFWRKVIAESATSAVDENENMEWSFSNL